MSLTIRNARILTLAGPAPRRGATHSDLGLINCGHVVISGGQIESVGPGDPPAERGSDHRTIDARGRVVMPGFVDAHTHACWAGDRLDEWELKQRGASYLDILKTGGGIMATVRATRAASQEELAGLLVQRLRAALRCGTTTVEVKSGYGLNTEDELKMLRAIRDADRSLPMTVVPTACIGHAIDPQHPGGSEGFVKQVIEHTLPAVHRDFPGVALDAYCEQGAWSLEQTARLFEAAAALGHPLRVHADQFNQLGMTRWAVEHRVLSVDHLEATDSRVLGDLARSDVYGVMLPCSGFHVDGRYADGRTLLDGGGRLVLGSNYNPGSSPCHSMPMAVALAVRHLGVTAAEAVSACTVNGACLLGFEDRGVVAAGRRADLILLRHQDERQLGYEFGGDPVDLVVCGGEPVVRDELRA
jgi:imidazolonepropionase